MDDVRIFGNWVELGENNLKTDDQKVQFYGAICVARMGGAVESLTLDPEVRTLLAGMGWQIKRANDTYDVSKIKATDEDIYWAAHKNPGLKAKEIGDLLGCSESKIKHSIGWKGRKEESWEKVIVKTF